jgi:hypothetical protein
VNTANYDQLSLVYAACKRVPDDRRERLFDLLLQRAEELNAEYAQRFQAIVAEAAE